MTARAPLLVALPIDDSPCPAPEHDCGVAAHQLLGVLASTTRGHCNVRRPFGVGCPCRVEAPLPHLCESVLTPERQFSRVLCLTGRRPVGVD